MAGVKWARTTKMLSNLPQILPWVTQQFRELESFINGFVVTTDELGNVVIDGDLTVTGTISGGSPATDHGSLTGLTPDDDHPHYSLADGTRAFTGTVGGVSPTLAAHLATKGYVDGLTWDHGTQVTGLADDDHTQYHTDARALTWHSGLAGAHVTGGDTHDHVGGDGAQIDHGGLAGLGDDDHTQYHNATRHAAVNHDGFDGTAIHDNVAAEISAITLKASPVSGDHILIEDSAAGDAKKRITVGSLPTGVTDHGALTGLADDDHTQYHNAARHAAVSHAGLDTDAYHRNLGAEISGTPNKAAPVGADFLLIEDSASFNQKKHITISQLPGGTSDHGALTGLGDDDHTQYILANGSRAFTGEVAGVDPTAGASLSTKEYVDGVGQVVALQRNATLTLSTGVAYQKIALNVVNTTPNAAYYTTDIVNFRITVLKAGIYSIDGQFSLDANATGFRGIQIRLNGSTTVAEDLRGVIVTGLVPSFHINTIRSLAANDYLELFGVQNSGANRTIQSNPFPYLYIARISPSAL